MVRTHLFLRWFALAHTTHAFHPRGLFLVHSVGGQLRSRKQYTGHDIPKRQ